MNDDTIFAPITGRGGAVSVIRLSGGAALMMAERLCGGLPAPRRASLRALRDAGGRLLDHVLVVTFPAPRSFTGEDCVELSMHGGRAVLAAVSEALVAAGARPAEPGEFSRRAFINGRTDLLRAEAVADLIAAETEAQRRLAVEGADRLQGLCLGWREALRVIMARQEALIDFPDEDLPPDVEAAMRREIEALLDEMRDVLVAAPAAGRLREGLEFVILGLPNAGKSTLLNALAGAEVAIVSDSPGTTRDAVGVRLDLAGVAVHVTDTAGVRDTLDVVEAEGVKRALARAAAADLVIAVAAAPEARFAPVPAGVEAVRVVTKADLLSSGISDGLAVSALSGGGMPELVRQLELAAVRLTDTQGMAALARPRQVACIRDSVAALQAAARLQEPELRSEELRRAAAALARLTGLIGVEEILDAVFGSFCIGK